MLLPTLVDRQSSAAHNRLAAIELYRWSSERYTPQIAI
jgi:hypothetical protein